VGKHPIRSGVKNAGNCLKGGTQVKKPRQHLLDLYERRQKKALRRKKILKDRKVAQENEPHALPRYIRRNIKNGRNVDFLTNYR